VSQPYLNMYRPGSVTRPARCHVTLLTTDQPLGACESFIRANPTSSGSGPEHASHESAFACGRRPGPTD